jgi:16S rRNA (adenine1518-N6/adenine1519-N6)-dimethyltransferase
MHNFKKQFGQNFLKNAKYARIVVESLQIAPTDLVLEIGPGDGMLTKLLLETGAQVIAFEVDFDLIPKLLTKFEAYSNFKLVHKSILDVNLSEELKLFENIDSVKIAGSLPYNISKKIIDTCLRFNVSNTKQKIDSCSFIVQEEVAKDYVAAAPKSSFLSNYSKIFAKVRKLESIPNYMFFPQPKVNGGILKIEMYKDLNYNYEELHKLIRIGFSNPRKTLSNNLKSSGKYTNESIAKVFTDLSLSPTIRPAEVEFELWSKIKENLEPSPLH